MALSDLIGVSLGSVLTLLVFSFLIRDNPLFRLTLSIFIGAAAGYGVALAFYTVIWPQLLLPLLFGPQAQRLLALPPLALAILLLFKISPRSARVGNPAMAFLVGVGAAAAIGGAVLGTLFSQVSATVNVFDLQATGGFANPGRLAEAALILLGTLATLIYFHFGARRSTPAPAMSAPAPAEGGEPPEAEPAPAPAALPPAGSPALQRPEWVESLAWVGELFIAVTFGVLFAGAFSASLAALIERTQSFVETFQYYLR
jgi:hypothetical protein